MATSLRSDRKGRLLSGAAPHLFTLAISIPHSGGAAGARHWARPATVTGSIFLALAGRKRSRAAGKRRPQVWGTMRDTRISKEGHGMSLGTVNVEIVYCVH